MAAAPQIAGTSTGLANILFPTDFSEASARALPYALAVARQHDAIIHVTHVVTPARKHPGLSRIATDDAATEVFRIAEHKLQAMLEPKLIERVRCHSEVREGTVWGCVSNLIMERNINLVVLGTKAAGGLARAIHGSDAEEIFRESPCPVLTVGPQVRAARSGRFKEILFALDFTDQSMRAYSYALEFATESCGYLTVLHVVPPFPSQLGNCGIPEYTEMMRWLSIKEIRKATDYARHPVRPFVTVVFGDPAKVIVHYAEMLAADLIVMGIHHRKRLSTHLPWATAHEVVAHAPCPVLTVRS